MSWLQGAKKRYEQDGFGKGRTDLGLSGPLRGVTEIDWANLRKARELHAAKIGEGQYLVFDYETAMAWDPASGLSMFEWLMFPKWGQRAGELDLEGWNSYFVNLSERDVDPCHCRFMYIRGEAVGSPCKHMLRALMEEEHPFVLEKLAELRRRDAIAAAVS